MNHLLFILAICIFYCTASTATVIVNGQSLSDYSKHKEVTYTTKLSNIGIELEGNKLTLGSMKFKDEGLQNIVKFYQDNKDREESIKGKSLHLKTEKNNDHKNALVSADEEIFLQGNPINIVHSIFKSGKNTTLKADQMNFKVSVFATPKMILEPLTESYFESIQLKPMKNSPYPFQFCIDGFFDFQKNTSKIVFIGSNEIDVTFSPKAFQ